MFNFIHTEHEMRDIIQSLEARIASLQQHLQKLLGEANAQAVAMAAPKAEEIAKDQSHGGTD
jgi:hypothetical protein